MILLLIFSAKVTLWSRVILDKQLVAQLLEFPNILRNPKFHYHVLKSPSLVLNEIKPVHTTPSYLSMTDLLIYKLRSISRYLNLCMENIVDNICIAF
jgi:hypothetical protein